VRTGIFYRTDYVVSAKEVYEKAEKSFLIFLFFKDSSETF